MKNIASICLLYMIVSPLQAQRFSMETYGQENTDRGIGIEKALEGDGYIMVGYTKSFNSSGENIYVVKTNLEGQLIWQKTYGGMGDDNGWSIKQTHDNSYIIVGFSNSFGNGDWNIFAIKIDQNGNEIWSKNYGGAKDEYAWDLVVTSDNSYTIIGQTNDTENGETTSMCVRIDSVGNIIWKNQLHGFAMNRAFSIVEEENKSFLFTGLISAGKDNLDGFVAEVTSQGNLEWIKTYGGDQNDLGHSIKVGEDSHFLMFGYSKSYGTSNNSPWLVKINSKGEEVWNYTYGSHSEERIVGGFITTDNSCILLGYVIKESDQGANWDILLLKVDTMGNLDWLKTYGGKQNEESGQNLLISETGDIIFTGRTFSEGMGNGDLFLIKVTN